MQPHVYTSKSHPIHTDQIDSDALNVITILQKAGYTAYLVGGTVRDLLIGHSPKDTDISTSAKPEEIKKLFRNCILIGRRFRLAHIRFGHKVIDAATFRAGYAEDDTLIVRDNVWGTEEQDVLRRDFTINGLFYNPTENTIIDYVGGYDDIKNMILRTIGNPTLRFKQDPVRMIRLVKFKARFNLKTEDETERALLNSIHEISKSSPDRILGEMFKMLESKAAEPFFRLLTQFGFTDILFPYLAEFLQESKGEEVYQHLKACDKQNSYSLEKPVLIACLLFPILKYRIHTEFLSNEIIPNLGDIFNLSHDLIHNYIVQPFPRFPRWMRSSLNYILNAQYRFTPITFAKRMKRNKLFSNKDFPLALRFLWIRAHSDGYCAEQYSKLKRLNRMYQNQKRDNRNTPK